MIACVPVRIISDFQSYDIEQNTVAAAWAIMFAQARSPEGADEREIMNDHEFNLVCITVCTVESKTV